MNFIAINRNMYEKTNIIDKILCYIIYNFGSGVLSLSFPTD